MLRTKIVKLQTVSTKTFPVATEILATIESPKGISPSASHGTVLKLKIDIIIRSLHTARPAFFTGALPV